MKKRLSHKSIAIGMSEWDTKTQNQSETDSFDLFTIWCVVRDENIRVKNKQTQPQKKNHQITQTIQKCKTEIKDHRKIASL